ncbi:uncharacterized protein L969DRAFT_53591 [Mixia osmundae IAM 14324]|uniref:Guanylate kinase n=1 Tax=Mixia osmundae (strain CBS 9802 / IAM 14324 / JCM 22182 / KY 12970) TaxID=764103 RepID=G7DSZ3_MIXOS|nr:uncharacterized protein L969DRAFT_53591 [Mixia osmundae IAM 14324]KEI37214.1 hypothetical protein L969DRAFT_53591 [Mixia osmundae IAM 14324]GAA93703.1 hypothetical protein E5Q_00348 [Mixia osmundae IAM 14324]
MSSAASLRPIVISGPSGTGKSTLLKRLFDEYPDTFGFSVSHTTRKPRPGEEDGKAYHFVSRDAFKELIDQNGFVEHAEFSKNLYGTSVKAIQDVAGQGRRCVLDIDSQGVKLIKANHAHLKPIYVFLSPPSLASLRTRLSGRGTESEDSLRSRLEASKGEIEYARTGAYDTVIVNDDLDKAYQKLKAVAVEDRLEADSKVPPMDEDPAELAANA